MAASLESAGSTAPAEVPTAISCQDRFLLDRRDNPEKALKALHQCTAVRNVAINMEYFTFWYVTLPPGSSSKQDWRFEKTWKSNIGILTSRVVNLEKDQAVSVLDESIARGLKRGRRGDLVEKWLANHNADILTGAQPVAAQGQTTPVAPVVAAASTQASSPPAAAATGKPAVVQDPARSEKASSPPPAQRTVSAAAASASVPPPPAAAEKPAAVPEPARPEKASTPPAAQSTASAAAAPVTTPGSTSPPAAEKPAVAPDAASPAKTMVPRSAQPPQQHARRTPKRYAPVGQDNGYYRASAAAGARPYPAPPPGAWYGPGPLPYYGPQPYYPAPAGPYGAPPYYPPPAPVAQAPPPAPLQAAPPAPVMQATPPVPVAPPAAPSAPRPAQPPAAVEQSRPPAPASSDMAQRTLLEREIDKNVRSMSQMIENNVRTIEQTLIKPTFFNK